MHTGTIRSPRLVGLIGLCALAGAAIPARSATLVGYWTLDEGAGSTVADSSGNGNNGTLTGTPTPTWVAGKLGNALNFASGGKAYVSISGAGSLANLVHGMTVAAWIKPRSAGGGSGGRIVDKDNNSGGWFLAMNGSTAVRFAVDEFPSVEPSRLSASSLALNTWQHVAATWDGSTAGANIHLYINGVAADGASIDGAGVALDDSDTPFAIGNRPEDLARSFDGTIDDVRVYNGVLSAAEIAALAGVSPPPPDTQAPTVPTGLASSNVTASGATISWIASTDLPNPGGTGVGGYYVYRNGSISPVATVTAGTSFSDTGLSSATTYSYQVAAFDKASPVNVSAKSAILNVVTQSAQSGLTGSDVGAVGAAGSSTVSGGTYTVKGAGADIFGTADAFQFDSQAFTGDGSITARVVSQTNTNAWAKAGVMFRETLTAGSRFALVAITPTSGSEIVARTSTNGSAVSIHGALVKDPYWVRLVRAKNVLTGYISPDGKTWTTIGNYTVTMASALRVGLAVTSHVQGTLSTAVFDNVTISSTPLVTLSPVSPTLAVGASLQFTATVTNATNTSVTWQVNGVPGGAAATGTIDASGRYTAPSSISGSSATFTITAVSAQDTTASASTQVTVTNPTAPGVDVTTYKYDQARTGLNAQESTLTTANVRSATFGLKRILPADGMVYAQPLYLAKLTVSGSSHNVVYVASEHNSVYAYDADSGAQLWKVSVNGANETSSDTRSCDNITPEIGITATPVIDRTAGPHGALYVVAMTVDNNGTYHQRLHALDVSTGAELFGGPAEIQATYPTSTGTTTFDPGQYKERAGLLLLQGEIYTTWASHCDDDPYTGWVIAYNGSTLARTRVLNVAPNSNNLGPAIWMSGGAPAADSANNIYLLTGNGVFETTMDANGFPSLHDYGNTFLKLSTAGGSLAVSDYWTMWNEVSESNADLDLGGSCALLLPDMTDASGITRHLAIGGGKDGNFYIVNRDQMGRFNASSNAIWQEIDGSGAMIRSTFAYFNGRVYISERDLGLKAYTFTSAKVSASPTSQTSATFGYPGTMPIVSANGTSNGIVWAPTGTTTGILHAYDATNLATELYNSTQAAGNRDAFGAYTKFATPMEVAGKVFVGTKTGVAVFGLL